MKKKIELDMKFKFKDGIKLGRVPVLALLLLSQAILTAHATTEVTGKTPGNFTVADTGAATYSIPIDIPAGINGMQPQIELSYSSLAGQSHAGYGFSLNAASQISRCQASYATEGYRGAVTFDADDRYCMDGQKLVQVAGDSYGAAGSEYITEFRNWSKIVASDSTCGSAPCGFVVTDKSGTVHEYGDVDGGQNAQVNPEGSAEIVTWFLHKVTDLNGNYIVYNYNQDTTSYTLDSIQYTGNDAAAVAPLHTVSFSYSNEDSNDAYARYLNGHVLRQEKLLDMITVMSGYNNTVIRAYHLAYGADSVNTGRTLLTSVQECNDDTASPSYCLPATEFTWSQNAEGALALHTYDATSSIAHTDFQNRHAIRVLGDYDGDGRSDVFVAISGGDRTNLSSTDRTTVMLSNGDGTFTGIAEDLDYSAQVNSTNENSEHPERNTKHLVADFNGDGWDDIAAVVDNTPTRVFFSDGDGTFTRGAALSSAPSGYYDMWDLHSEVQADSGDFNGDGIDDILVSKNDNHVIKFYIYFFDETGRSTIQQVSTTHSVSHADYQITVGTFNADIMDDFMVKTYHGSHYTYTFLSRMKFNQPGDTHKVSFTKVENHNYAHFDNGTVKEDPHGINTGDIELLPGDYNGDGLTDIATRKTSANLEELPVWFSRGDGTYYITYSSIPDSYGAYRGGSRQANTGDFNGDGLTDIMVTSHNKWTSAEFWFSKGDGSFDYASEALSSNLNKLMNNEDYQVQTADFIGNGMDNALVSIIKGKTPSNSQPLVVYSQQQVSDHITSITDGLDGVVNISYKPLTSDDVYSKGNAAVYPLKDLQIAQYVVSQHALANGCESADDPSECGFSGTSQSYTYMHEYQGLRTDVSGRGLLPFYKVLHLDVGADLRTIKTYETDFPKYYSLKEVLVQQYATSQNVSKKLYGYSAVTDSSITPNVYSVRKSDEEDRLYDPNNDNLFTKTVTGYEYDNYDNVEITTAYGDSSDSAENVVITCTAYNVDTSAWILNQVDYVKVLENGSSCHNSKTWTANTLKLTDYDYYADNHNLQYVKEYLDTDSRWVTTSTLTYDAFGNLETKSDALGRVTAYTYESTSHTYPASVTYPSPGTDADGNPITLRTFFYHEPNYGVLLAKEDFNGNYFTYDYGHDTWLGRISSVQGPDPDGNQVDLERYSYADEGSGTFYTRVSTRRNWDDDNSANWDWTETYVDSLERRYKTVHRGYGTGDPDILQVMHYDAAGRLWKKSLPYAYWVAPSYQETTYTPSGLRDTVTEPAPMNAATRYAYAMDFGTGKDYKMQVIATVPSPTGTGTETQVVNYDARGRKIASIDALGRTSLFHYDGLSRLKTGTDPLGMVTTRTYDSFGQLTSIDQPERGTESYAYDDVGNPTQLTKANGDRIQYRYDALNRLYQKRVTTDGVTAIERRYYDTSSSGGDNVLGRLTRINGANGDFRKRYSYDAYGRVDEYQLKIAARNDWHVFDTEHNPDGTVNSHTFPDGELESVSYHFNGAVNEQKLNDVTKVRHFGYNLFGQPQFKSYQGTDTAYTYDGIGRLNSLLTRDNSNATWLNYAYTYIPQTHRLAEIASSDNDYGAAGTFSYTEAGELKTVEDMFNVIGNDNSYVYDANHNLKSKTDFEENNGNPREYDWDFSYDIAGKQNQMSGYVKSDGNAINLSYDESGLTQKADTNQSPDDIYYVFNGLEQLTEVKQGTSEANAETLETYLYDESGKRIRKTTYASDGTIAHDTWYYGPQYEVSYSAKTNDTYHSKYLLGMEGRLYEKTQLESNVNLVSQPTPSAWMSKMRYASMPLLPIIVFLLLLPWRRRILDASSPSTTSCAAGYALIFVVMFSSITPVPAEAALSNSARGNGMPAATGERYYHFDHNHNLVMVSDGSGNVDNQIGYQPYGAIYDASGVNDFRYKWGGKELDDATGLYYFGARYYSPTLERFISPDPAWQYNSPYIYGGGDPINNYDPDGRKAWHIEFHKKGYRAGSIRELRTPMGDIHNRKSLHTKATANQKAMAIRVGIIVGSTILSTAAMAAFPAASVESGLLIRFATRVLISTVVSSVTSATSGYLTARYAEHRSVKSSEHAMALEAGTGAAIGFATGLIGAAASYKGDVAAIKAAKAASAVEAENAALRAENAALRAQVNGLESTATRVRAGWGLARQNLADLRGTLAETQSRLADAETASLSTQTRAGAGGEIEMVPLNRSSLPYYLTGFGGLD